VSTTKILSSEITEEEGLSSQMKIGGLTSIYQQPAVTTNVNRYDKNHDNKYFWCSGRRNNPRVSDIPERCRKPVV